MSWTPDEAIPYTLYKPLASLLQIVCLASCGRDLPGTETKAVDVSPCKRTAGATPDGYDGPGRCRNDVIQPQSVVAHLHLKSHEKQ